MAPLHPPAAPERAEASRSRAWLAKGSASADFFEFAPELRRLPFCFFLFFWRLLRLPEILYFCMLFVLFLFVFGVRI